MINSSLRVIYSFVGKFADKGTGETAYNLIKPFFGKRYLKKIITTSFLSTDLPDELFSCIKTVIIRGLRFFPWGDSFNYLVRDNIFDLRASRLVRDCDLFFGWSNASLFSLRKAKKIKAKTIIFSGSTHILTHNRLIKEEYNKFGKEYNENRWLINRHLQEYREADYIGVHSNFAVNSFLENGIPREKLIFIPYGIDTEKYKPLDKKDNIFRVLAVGRICLRKGIQYLLEAWSRLRLENSELILLGQIDGQMEGILAYYKKRCIFKICDFDPDTLSYYSQASVVACPSIEEGSTGVAYEALSCGVPVIASVNAGVDHIIIDGKTGFIVPVRDSLALENKIKFLYDNRENLAEMSKTAREDMVNNHSYEKFALDIVSIFENLK